MCEPYVTTVAPLEIRVDGPLSYNSIHTEPVYFLRTERCARFKPIFPWSYSSAASNKFIRIQLYIQVFFYTCNPYTIFFFFVEKDYIKQLMYVHLMLSDSIKKQV